MGGTTNNKVEKIVVTLRTEEELEIKPSSPDFTFLDLKKQLCQREGIQPERQRLFYGEIAFEIPRSWDDAKLSDTIRILDAWAISATEEEGVGGDVACGEVPAVVRIAVEFPRGSGGGGGQEEAVRFETEDYPACVIKPTGWPVRGDFQVLPIHPGSDGVVKLEKDFLRNTKKFGLVFQRDKMNRGTRGEYFVFYAQMYRVPPGSRIKLVKVDDHNWKAYAKEKTENGEIETLLNPINIKEFDQSEVISRLQCGKMLMAPIRMLSCLGGACGGQ